MAGAIRKHIEVPVRKIGLTKYQRVKQIGGQDLITGSLHPYGTTKRELRTNAKRLSKLVKESPLKLPDRVLPIRQKP